MTPIEHGSGPDHAGEPEGPAPLLIDSHAHLDSKPFRKNLPELLARARQAGVTRILQVGTDPPSWERSLELTGRHPELLAILGLQVHACTRHSPELLARLARTIEAAHGQVVALGEIGLDFHYDYPRQAQTACFRDQLALAGALGLPVVLHTREAEAETLAVLNEQADRTGAPLRGLVHCFSGGPEFASACLGLGLDLSFSGTLTYSSAHPIAAAAALVPWDRVHIETDCPYLSPVPVRTVRPNEPAFLPHTLRCLARLRSVSDEFAAQRTRANTRRLFGLPE